MTTMEIFAWLLIGHAIADYPLQTEWVARAKQPQTIDGAAAGQRDQPGKRLATLLIEVPRPPPNLDEHILKNVLRFFAAVQYTDEQAE